MNRDIIYYQVVGVFRKRHSIVESENPIFRGMTEDKFPEKYLNENSALNKIEMLKKERDMIETYLDFYVSEDIISNDFEDGKIISCQK